MMDESAKYLVVTLTISLAGTMTAEQIKELIDAQVVGEVDYQGERLGKIEKIVSQIYPKPCL